MFFYINAKLSSCKPVYIIIHTFFKGRVAEEEVVAAACRRCLAAVGPDDGIQSISNLIHLLVDSEHALLEELVSWHVLADVEVRLEATGRTSGLHTTHRQDDMSIIEENGDSRPRHTHILSKVDCGLQ